MTDISVVVPCYNYGRELKLCLASVLEQEGVDLEVLVIDDCSSDDSFEVARAVAARDPRVSVRQHEVNQGNIATYNEGLLEATGRYTLLISADDLLTPGALRRAVAALDANPGAGFVYGHVIYFDDDRVLPTASSRQSGVTVWHGQDWMAGRFRSGHNVISSPEVVVRTELQQRLGGYRPDLQHAGDLEMWLRLAAHADVAFIRGADQAFYRKHPQSMTRTIYAGALADLDQRRTAFERVLTEQTRIPLAVREAWRGQISRVLAREALQAASRAYDRGQLAETPVDELVAFADDMCSTAHRSPAGLGLAVRQRLGERICSSMRPFAVTALARRVQRWLWWRRWARTGV